MFHNLVIGVDGRDGGRDAIALAKHLVAPTGELSFTHIYGSESLWPHPAHDHVAHTHGLEMLAAAREDADAQARLRCAAASSVGEGLHVLAEGLDADLIVVGSSRRGRLDRVLLGDDTRAVLGGASCAVAIAPAGYGARATVIREVGVGYDGSAECDHALAVARKLAGEHGAKLSAFEAIALPRYLFSGGSTPPESALEEYVEATRGRLAKLGVEAHAAYGNPAEELALYGASLDLLVIASRDNGALGRLLHGSTSQQLARCARCPLLVLTPAARAAQAGKRAIGTVAALR